MEYEIRFNPSAEKQLAKAPTKDQRRIANRIDGLAHNPRPRGSKKLEGSELYRIRVGDWRVVYQIRDDVLLVLVVRIGNRKDVYKHLP